MFARLKARLHTVEVAINALLLFAVPFTEQIVQGVNDYLPSFAPYLPPNIYKTVGCIVVGYNMVRAISSARQASQAKGGVNG